MDEIAEEVCNIPSHNLSLRVQICRTLAGAIAAFLAEKAVVKLAEYRRIQQLEETIEEPQVD